MYGKIPGESILVSILIFSGTDNIEKLLSDMPHKLSSVCKDIGLTATVVIRKNNPSLNTDALEKFISKANEYFDQVDFVFADNKENSGFGRGHNLNFQKFPSDYFLILNDDLDIPNMEWMRVAIPRLRSEAALAMIGAESNPNAINPFFTNGTFSDKNRNFTLRYAEASILLLRSSAFESIGMFDETIAWAMGEDSDLSFKAQQAGYCIEWISIPHTHFRSTSFNSLPGHQKSSVLEHNRARLMAKWGNSLETGKIGKFEVIDIHSNGLGDMFCALIHVRAEYDRLPRSMHDHIIVNSGNEALSRTILPEHAKVVSEHDLSTLRAKVGNDHIASLRSIRNVNYAMPYNIHSLVSGSLSLPFAEGKTLHAISKALKSASSTKKIDEEYCVVHLEFDREGHYGRGPSLQLRRDILASLDLLNCTVVLIGRNKIVNPEDFGETAFNVIDLQGGTSLQEMISLVANAKFFVGIDSFPFHVAQAANIPSAAFFGSVNPILRIFPGSRVWPIVSDLDCLGCYHMQIEPGTPFCMRMNSQCTYDIPKESIRSIVGAMTNEKLYDWSVLNGLLNKKLARFVEYQKFHPTSRAQLHDTIIPNQQISSLIYELTDRISQMYSRHHSGAFQTQLQQDNARLRSLLLDAQTRANSYQAVTTLLPRDTEKMPVIPASQLLWRTSRCSVSDAGGELMIDSTDVDPQIQFAPVVLDGKRRFGISLTARSFPPARLKVYWKLAGPDYSEENTFSMATDEHSASRVWWYTGPVDRPIFIRLDPSDGPGRSHLSVNFVGDFSEFAMHDSLRELDKLPVGTRLARLIKRGLRQ